MGTVANCKQALPASWTLLYPSPRKPVTCKARTCNGSNLTPGWCHLLPQHLSPLSSSPEAANITPAPPILGNPFLAHTAVSLSCEQALEARRYF